MKSIPVIKIDIEKQELMVPEYQNIVYGLNFGKNDFRPFPEDYPPQYLNHIKKVEYKIYQFITEKQELKHYALKEFQLFNDILNIAENELKIKLYHSDLNGYSRGYSKGHNSGYLVGNLNGAKDTTDHIKSLPWWKRLFNRF